MKFSKFISYFFHPINFPILGSLLYFLFIPKYIFKVQEHLILIVLFIGTYIFPLFLLLLLKRFRMIESYHMKSIEERKFPTLLFITICLILANWLFKTSVVNILALFYLGYGIGLLLSYILLYFNRKVSLHTAAIGGLIGFLMYFSYYYKINLIILISSLILLSGVMASARLRLHAHSIKEVFYGYIIGIGAQLIAFYIYIM